jgi:[acyl-carrier-protein] S-malonyltransferase
MLQELADTQAVVKQTFAQASQVLGYDVLQLALQGPEAQLNQTEYTQPALLTASVAIWRVLQPQITAMPAVMAGHSLGEYSALVCADSISFEDAVALVAERGRLMQAAVPVGQGAMAAILGLEPAAVAAACEEAAQGEIVAPANLNAIGQIVISGQAAAVERAVEIAKAKGAKLAKLLPVSVPSHCDLMRPAAEKLAEKLAKISIQAPRCKVLHNVDVESHSEPAMMRERLIQQLYSPVRWIETMQYCANAGIVNVLELGPGKVLMGLNKRIDNRLQTTAVYDTATVEQAITVLNS